MTFGSVITAMVTPFSADGSVDFGRVGPLVDRLLELGNDGLVINGTTGESATVDDDEKNELLREVVLSVSGRAKVIAGVGSNDTAHSIRLAKAAKAAGADASLIVTPYYNKPSAEGLYAHFVAVAQATDLPVMIYDIPGRSAVAIPKDVMLKLAEHPLILANKDARADLAFSSEMIRNSGLQWFSGDDILNLPMLSIGAYGFVSVCGHLVADRLKLMREQFFSGDINAAINTNSDLVPIYLGVMSKMPGVMAVKAALAIQGHLENVVRLPLVPASSQQITQLQDDLALGGIKL
ncbi:MAG: 4-hydroxy-tetrahydrodipicolinate synthase [Actinobacteria bacterium]|nr:4-hydroxy-tetrahydrodipicolinate synthase [Actinomycetota bacterium]